MTKTQYFEFGTKPSLFSGKGTFLRNLFLRNKANFNHSNITATSYFTVGYDTSQTKPQNGANPNEANLKPISNTTKTSLLLGEPAISKKLFYGKRTQFQGVKSVASNCCRKVYDALLQKGNEPKRTQTNPIKANFKTHQTPVAPKPLAKTPNPIHGLGVTKKSGASIVGMI